jgi:hypothetical protein
MFFKQIRDYLNGLDVREVRELEDGLQTGYYSNKRIVAKKRVDPKQDFQNGMLARLQRFDESRWGNLVLVFCGAIMVALVMAAANLFLERPFF